MTKLATGPSASFMVRWFLALHATVPAAVLVAVLVHLWPPAGLPPLAQRPVWAVWTLIATWLAASLLESGVSPFVGRLSDRRGRLYPCLIGLTLGAGMMLLFPWPNAAWQLVVLVILVAPAVGMLWAPSMALLSDGAEALGIAQGFAFAFSNLGWSIGQTVGAAASARLADATSDAVPYLLLSCVCCVTIAVLVRSTSLRVTEPEPS